MTTSSPDVVSGAVRFDDPRPVERFLSPADCERIAREAIVRAHGGGLTSLVIDSSWSGNVRWTRNQILSSGDRRNNMVAISRDIRGAQATASINRTDGAQIEACVRRAERLLRKLPEDPEASLKPYHLEAHSTPNLWFDSSYQLLAPARADMVHALVRPARQAGMLAAGYLEVSARGRAIADSSHRCVYFPYTTAQYSVTVRDPDGRGSGWAGVNGNDWARIDANRLSEIALEKCMRSRNPVATEPGRYTTILEPQAVCDLVAPLFDDFRLMDRDLNEFPHVEEMPFMGARRGESKIGQRIIDTRLTFSADPLDPDLGVVPMDVDVHYGEGPSLLAVYHPVVWIERGVLKALAYDREFAVKRLLRETALPNSKAFRMSGGATSVEEMMASTKRGIVITRFSGVRIRQSELGVLGVTGVTRDGIWLVENGQMTKPVKNFMFHDSLFRILNNVLDLGVPQRTFRVHAPAVVPPLKVDGFNFTAIADSI